MDLARLALENLGGISTFGGVMVLLVYVILRDSAGRKAYQHALAAAEQRHATEMDRMRERVDGLEKRVQELTAALDAERRKRWRAEDVAAGVRRAGSEE